MVHGYETKINKMVDDQLIPRGIKSAAVLQVMRTVPRHLFVSEELLSCAYDDMPLPIGSEQTISQPYIVAFMTEQLDLSPGMRVLEIGTGSGYQTAVLARLGCDVYTVEYVESLSARAKRIFSVLKFTNIQTMHGNGYMGWMSEAPFDKIIVTAAPDRIPVKLIEQLKDGGKMIIPVGEVGSTQWLKTILKNGGDIIETDLLPVRFVPMVGCE